MLARLDSGHIRTLTEPTEFHTELASPNSRALAFGHVSTFMRFTPGWPTLRIELSMKFFFVHMHLGLHMGLHGCML
ncbi:hypothetical protein GCM10009525_03400 [Streptosporangium amethystogenes subsp. fukuiense]